MLRAERGRWRSGASVLGGWFCSLDRWAPVTGDSEIESDMEACDDDWEADDAWEDEAWEDEAWEGE